MNRQGSLNLLGKLLGSRPDMNSIERWVMARWKPIISMDLTAMPNAFFMIKLIAIEDKERILNGGLGWWVIEICICGIEG